MRAGRCMAGAGPNRSTSIFPCPFESRNKWPQVRMRASPPGVASMIVPEPHEWPSGSSIRSRTLAAKSVASSTGGRSAAAGQAVCTTGTLPDELPGRHTAGTAGVVPGRFVPEASMTGGLAGAACRPKASICSSRPRDVPPTTRSTSRPLTTITKHGMPCTWKRAASSRS